MLDLWNNLLDLLPFDWTNYEFMKTALLAVLIVTPLLGLLGTMIVNNKMSFFSDALGHSALTGMGIGVLFGLRNTDLSMVLFAIIFALGIIAIKYTQKSAMDTTIGVFSSTAVALGIVLLSSGGFNKYSALLIGDVLSITAAEIWMLLGLFLLVIVLWCLLFNTMLLVSTNPALAASRGIPVVAVDALFTVLIAMVVTLSIKWVGILIINSLFILPAASARMISRNMRTYTVLSILIALVCGIVGLLVSFYANTSAGATIALLCAIVYFVTMLIKRRQAAQ